MRHKHIPRFLLCLILLLVFCVQAQAATYATYPLFRAADNNDVPLVGGKLYSYVPGTSTAKATYSTAGLSSANTNPVILNARGETSCPVYLSGATDLILKDANGVTIWGPITVGSGAGTTNINVNTTIPAGVVLTPANGDRYNIANGVTLTINGTLEAGVYQIFNCIGTGTVVFGSGSAKEVYPEWWGANTTPGTTDMTTAVQAALTAGAGKEVLFHDYEYKITSTLKLNGDYTQLVGTSWKSCLSTALDIEILSNDGNATTGINNVTIKNLWFKNSYPVVAGAGSTKFHVHLINPISALIDRCYFSSNFATTDYNTANRGGVWFELDTLYAILNRINNCFIDRGSVRFDTSDSTITNSWVWGYTCDYAIMINNGNVDVLDCGGIIGSRSHGAIYLPVAGGTAGGQKINGNYIGGAVTGGNNGYGVYAVQPIGLVINGNTFHQMDYDGIYCQDGVNCSITGNSFLGGNTQSVGGGYTGAPDITLEGTIYNPSQYSIIGNAFYRSIAQGDSVVDAIHFVGAVFPPRSNIIAGNTINGTGRYNDPPINFTLDPNLSNKLANNVGAGLANNGTTTWTPLIKGSTADGVGTYTSQVGLCSVSGDTVTISGQITWTNHTGTGNLLISGFPYAVTSLTGYTATGNILATALVYTKELLQLLTGTNLTILQLWQRSAADANATEVPITTSGNINFTITYQKD